MAPCTGALPGEDSTAPSRTAGCGALDVLSSPARRSTIRLLRLRAGDRAATHPAGS